MDEMPEYTLISRNPLSGSAYLRSLFRSRHLILTFAERDLKIKYAQTFLGIGWSVLQPLITLLIYYFFFGFVLKMKTGDVPYLVFTFSGITLWSFFNYIVYQASTVLIEKQDIIRRLSFPRLTLLLSKVLVAGAELLISILMLFVLLFIYETPISKFIFLFPVAIVLCSLVGLSIAFWISALSLQFRDIIHTIPYLISLGIWLTPVFYPITFLPESLNFLHYLNPIAGPIELFRYCIIANYTLDYFQLTGSIVCVPVFIAGFYYFKNAEQNMMNYL